MTITDQELLDFFEGSKKKIVEILGGPKLDCSPETFDDLKLLAREFGHNALITPLVPQETFPGMRKVYTGHYKNWTETPEGQRSKPNSSPFAMALLMCNAAYP
jgi:hypothetical protein